MAFTAKIHGKDTSREIIAACDSEILGKTLVDKFIVFHVYLMSCMFFMLSILLKEYLLKSISFMLLSER